MPVFRKLSPGGEFTPRNAADAGATIDNSTLSSKMVLFMATIIPRSSLAERHVEERFNAVISPVFTVPRK